MKYLFLVSVFLLSGCSDPMVAIEKMESSCPGYFSFTYSYSGLAQESVKVNCTETAVQRLDRLKKYNIADSQALKEGE